MTGGRADRTWLVERLRERFGAREVLLTDSGTSALRLGLEGAAAASRAARGGSSADEAGPAGGAGAPAGGAGAPPPVVALPAYSCYDLATAAEGARARVVLYDLVPSSLAPEPESVRRALAAGARTVVVAPLYGVPVALEWLYALCAGRDAVLIEDAAQGIGAAYRGEPLGSGGSLAVLSFARGKGWTGGGGGALFAHDDAGVTALRAAGEANGGLRSASRGWGGLGRAAAQWALGRPAVYGLPRRLPGLRLGETVYRRPWRPAGLPAAAAAGLRATEEAAEEESRRRRANARRLLRAIEAGSRLEAIAIPPGAEPGWLRLPVLLPERSVAAFRPPERLGVYRGYPTPLHRLDALRPWLAEPEGGVPSFPGAEILASRLVTLPTHGALRERDVEALEAWIRGV